MSAGPRAFFAILSAALAIAAGIYLVTWQSGVSELDPWTERVSRGLGGFMFACGLYFLARLWPEPERRPDESDEA